MPKTIYIVGTDHKYQHRCPKFSEEQHAGFERHISQIIMDLGVALLAEENCEQAVKENNLTESVLQRVAQSHSIQHLFCELDRKTRSERGMGSEDNIRISGMMNNIALEDIEQRIQESYRTREIHWLQCILNTATWPTLFVCGANHAIPFHQLVSQSYAKPILLFEDWSN